MKNENIQTIYITWISWYVETQGGKIISQEGKLWPRCYEPDMNIFSSEYRDDRFFDLQIKI